MRVRKLEIVADGIQKNGQPVTKAQLESVVRNYKPDARPPVTPGHQPKAAIRLPRWDERPTSNRSRPW